MASINAAKELLVKVGYGNIACKVWGDATAAVERFVGVHGWLDNAGSFDPLMQHFLNKNRCVVCVDLPGHGLSSHLPNGIAYSPATDLQAMRSVTKHLGWQKYNLIGHSMGAMRCQLYALCWSHEVKSVTSLDGVILGLDHLYKEERAYTVVSRQIDKFLDFNAEYHRRNREHSWEELSDRWLSAVAGLTADDFAILMKRGGTKLDNGSYVLNRDVAQHNRINAVLIYTAQQIIEGMKKLTDCPQIIIRTKTFGFSKKREQEVGNMINPFIESMVTSCPSKIEIVEFDGEHHYHMQQPMETAAIMNKFLSQVGPSTDDCSS